MKSCYYYNDGDSVGVVSDTYDTSSPPPPPPLLSLIPYLGIIILLTPQPPTLGGAKDSATTSSSYDMSIISGGWGVVSDSSPLLWGVGVGGGSICGVKVKDADNKDYYNKGVKLIEYMMNNIGLKMTYIMEGNEMT